MPKTFEFVKNIFITMFDGVLLVAIVTTWIQNNSYDCGVYVCMYSFKVCSSCFFDYNDLDSKSVRNWIATNIISKPNEKLKRESLIPSNGIQVFQHRNKVRFCSKSQKSQEDLHHLSTF